MTDQAPPPPVQSGNEAAKLQSNECCCYSGQPQRPEKHLPDYAGLAFVIACIAAGFSWYQGWVARDAEKQSLRAYVNVTKIGAVIDPTTNLVTIRVVFKNFGQTPATHVSEYACIATRVRKMIANAIDVSPTDLPESYLKKLAISKSVIAPKVTVNKEGAAWCDKASAEKLISSFNTPLSGDERAALKAGTSALYLYGEISYSDAFGYHRVTRYRSYTNDGIAGGGDHVVYDTEGNCTDGDCPQN